MNVFKQYSSQKPTTVVLRVELITGDIFSKCVMLNLVSVWYLISRSWKIIAFTACTAVHDLFWIPIQNHYQNKNIENKETSREEICQPFLEAHYFYCLHCSSRIDLNHYPIYYQIKTIEKI